MIKFDPANLTEEQIDWLQQQIDKLSNDLRELTIGGVIDHRATVTIPVGLISKIFYDLNN